MAAWHADLERALALGASMLEAASGQNWEQAAELDSKRAALLHDALVPAPADRARLEQLLAQNAALAGLAVRARAELGEALGRHAHAHRALRTYIGNAR